MLGESIIELDARPSDAIALGIRTSAIINVSAHVLEQAKVTLVPVENPEGVVEAGEGAEGLDGEFAQEYEMISEEGIELENLSNIDEEKWEEILEDMDPDDFKYKQ